MSVKRLREFLKGEELDPENTDWREEPAAIGEHISCVQELRDSVKCELSPNSSNTIEFVHPTQ